VGRDDDGFDEGEVRDEVAGESAGWRLDSAIVNSDGVTGVRTDTAGDATAGGIEIRAIALGGLPSLSFPSITGEAGSMGASAGDSATEVRGGRVGDEAEVLRTRDNISAIL
jgi:hypothetical protein